jgi:hypothetical protein
MGKPLADAQVNFFPNSFNSMPTEILTLTNVIEAIQAAQYTSQVRRVRQILASEGKRAYDQGKAHLPAVTFGGTFAPSRGIAYLQQHSGIVHGDLDHLDDVAAMKRRISADPRTIYCFISPSGEGLKLGVHVPIVADDVAYKHAWQTVATAYEAHYGGRWDSSGKDVSRLCFVSHDPELYWNPEAELFDVTPPPASPPRPLTAPKTWGLSHHDTYLGYAERAIKTAVQMIQAAQMGTRHHTRLKAARLLGGYVAGSLLTEEQAYGALASALVGHTEDLERALKTVEDGLRYGQAHPITLDALEAERQQWIEAHRLILPTPHHETSDHDPWDGMNTLPLKPYTGYRGQHSRMRGKGATYGHSG